jgi:type II secretory pathway component PulM
MRAGRALAWTGAAVVLALVFLAYLQPQLAVTLANQLWSCF